MNEESCLLCYRCANCFDCPGCMHTLSTRATSISTQLPDDPAKTTMKKAYYLACGFCRWTSRDVGMADKSVGKSGGLGMRFCEIGSAVIAHRLSFLLPFGRQELNSELNLLCSQILTFMGYRISSKTGYLVFFELVTQRS